MNDGRYGTALALLSGIFLTVALVACQGEDATRTPVPHPPITIFAAPLQSTPIVPGETPETASEDLLEVHRIEPILVGSLLFIAHWDEDAQRWLVYDLAGAFTPDQLTPPPGVTIPPNPEIGTLTGMERGKLYDFHVRGDQIVNIVEGETGDWPFKAGANYIKWSR